MAYLIPTLERLRDQLSDLSMRNRSLRLARLPKSRAFDLAWLDERDKTASTSALKHLFSGRNVGVKVLDVGGEDPRVAPLHHGLTYLDREVRLVEQERGVYDLSVGFAFLCGNVADGRYLQAPLCLLPRRLVLDRRAKDGARWTLQPIGEADEVNVNRTLLLALQRFLDITIDPDEIEEALAAVLFAKGREGAWLDEITKELTATLAQRGLSVAASQLVWGERPTPPNTVPPLPTYKADEMPNQPVRRFELRPHAVLSRFPLADTAVLDDYDRFIEALRTDPNHPLGYAGALLGDTAAKQEVFDAATQAAPASPRLHIEATDESQEAVLARAMAGHSMAVHGPPGTGKSQFIANLVATAASQRKKVLVVSQKRAALDVVAQRLGADLARFVAVVHDPVRDRQALFTHIVNAVDAQSDDLFMPDDSTRRRTHKDVVAGEAWFAEAHTAMSSPGPDGLTAADIYAQRLSATVAPPAGLVRTLPPIAPEVLARELEAVEPYLEQLARARPAGTWQEDRPDWSQFDEDARDEFLDATIPAMATAIESAVAWNRAAPDGCPSLVAAVADQAAWRTLGQWCEQAMALSEAGWAVALERDGVQHAGDEGASTLEVPLQWNAELASQLPALRRAAANHDAWTETAAWATEGAALPDAAWPWLQLLARQNTNGNWSAILSREWLELFDILSKRDAAGGEVVDLASADAIEAACVAFESRAKDWYRVLTPKWYEAKREVAELLGVAAKADDLPAAIATWRARRAYSEALTAAPRTVATLVDFGLQPDVVTHEDANLARDVAIAAANLADAHWALSVSARALTPTVATTAEDMAHLVRRAKVGTRGRALLEQLQGFVDDVTAAWRELPARSRTLCGRDMPNQEACEKALKIAKHVARAGAKKQELDTAKAACRGWLGPTAEQRIERAVAVGEGEALAVEIGAEVSQAFRTAWEADRYSRAFEGRVPELAELAKRLAATPQVAATIHAAYAERAVRDLEARLPALRELTIGEVDVRRDRLRKTWGSLPEMNRRMLGLELAQRASGPQSNNAALRQRAAQKRLRWSLRKVVEHFWSGPLSNVLPIWLCSPETVAAAFPFQAKLFDLVIFDEASQLTVARGLTSAFRGATCIVAGDDQQLPPSNFFSASLVDDDDGIIDEETEESLLAKAKATTAESGLQWHYRSRYPELIQFSNHHFYNGTLRVAPVPIAHADPAPVEWVAVPGTWARATTTNEAEAQYAVELLHRYLEHHHDKSVGIITLNRQQSDRIEDLVAARVMQDAKFRSLWEAANVRPLDERPFVRNLENVQGDERDITILSVGYSADASGRVPLRFGALTSAGGERRLNVAVTRARQKMLVLCSFDPESQLDVEASVSEGARTLRAFLLYARNGGRRPDAAAPNKAQQTARLTMMRHIQAKLAERGWEADLDLGQSMARVDIAIRRKVDRQRYAMGVLLDGPGTAWAQTAIGREVGRVEYLRRYQWHVRPMPMRAWATAPEETLAALVRELEAADAGGVKAVDAPAVALPAVERFANLAQDAAPRVASRARFPSAPAAAKVATLLPLQEVVAVGMPSVPAAPAAVAQRVQPGSTVRYRHVDSDEAREITLTGPTVARGVRALNLDAPLADALMDATAGDVVQMSLNGDVRELELLEVLAPPLGI